MSDDPASADAVARSMGLGGDLPPAADTGQVLTLTLGAAWWVLRALAGHRRPFGRTAFNYGVVAAVFVLGILGADELLG